MNPKAGATPAKWKKPEQWESEPFQTIYDTDQFLLQARRTETRLTAAPAPRCGCSFRGIEELIRGAGLCAEGRAGQVLKVSWRREVAWQKAIHITERQ